MPIIATPFSPNGGRTNQVLIENRFGTYNADVYADKEATGNPSLIAISFAQEIVIAGQNIDAAFESRGAHLWQPGEVQYPPLVTIETVFAGIGLYRSKGGPEAVEKYKEWLDEANAMLAASIETSLQRFPPILEGAPAALNTRSACDTLGPQPFGWGPGWGVIDGRWF